MEEEFFDTKIKEIINENAQSNIKYSEFNKYIIPRVKNSIESMWKIYGKYAPKNFKKKMLESKECFYQRWWEMYLGTKLLEYGFNIETNSKDIGPDFKIVVNNEIYWIEAVAPENGNSEINSLEEMQINSVAPLPKNEFLLRLGNAISNKIEKYEKYFQKGIVKNNDKLIIAISTCNLGQYGSLMDFPCLAIDTILYGIGNLCINLKTKEKFVKCQKEIFKRKGSIINTGIFDEKSIISGIIYTHDEPLNIYGKIYFRKNPNIIVQDDFKEHFIV